MKTKKMFVLFGGVIALVCVFIFLFSSILNNFSQIKLYLEDVSTRQVVSSENFSLVWNKETEDGNRNIVYTQLFLIDEDNLIYAKKHYLSSIEYTTGNLRWSIPIPEYSIFNLYEDKLYSLAFYDNKIPFAPELDIKMPQECHSNDLSTMYVYNPHNGERVWGYSYHMAAPYRGITFKNHSAFIQGLTVAVTNKYISELEIDLLTGEIFSVSCRNLNDYSYSNEERTEGVMSSGFGPLYDDLSWKLLKVGQLAMVVEGSRLTMLNQESKQPVGFIEFSGRELNPFDVQMVYQNDILIICLEDSNQLFAFRVE